MICASTFRTRKCVYNICNEMIQREISKVLMNRLNTSNKNIVALCLIIGLIVAF